MAEMTLACASGSTSQTTTIVTPSPQAVVCVTALLELARWCQQHPDFKEEQEPCPNANPEHLHPPGHSEAHGATTLAATESHGSAGADRHADADAATTPSPRPRARRTGGA